MGKNTGKGYRNGAMAKTDQVYNGKIDRFIKRDEKGQFVSQKKTQGAYKGITVANKKKISPKK